MPDRSIKTKVLNSMLWKILEQAGSQGIQFVVALVLARLMTPEEYGTISLIMIFITIANTFVQSGFATALVQKQDVTDEDYSSVFWCSMLLAAAGSILLSLSAPAIAVWYGRPVLVPLVRVMSLVLFPGAVVSIQTACIARRMQFRILFLGTMLAVLVSGGAAILLALRGFGVWAMAAQQIVYYITLMCVLFILLDWRPGRTFRGQRLRNLFSFGWKILASGLIDTIWMNVYGLVIGRRYSPADLGIYSRGEQFPKLVATNLSAAVQAVMLPAYASRQEDPEALRSMLRQSLRMSAFVMFPMMAGLAAVSRPLVLVLLTEKWAAAAPYLAIMCLAYAIYPIHENNLQVINAMGRSDLFLRLEILKKAIGIVVLLLSLPYGILPMLCLKVLDEYLCSFINAWPNRRLIQYGPLRQWKDLLPSAAASLLMAAAVAALPLLPKLLQPANAGVVGSTSAASGSLGILSSLLSRPLPTLLLQIALGIPLYILLSYLLNRDMLREATRLFFRRH